MLTMRCARAAVVAGLMAAWPSIGAGQEAAAGRTGQGTIAGQIVVRGTDRPVAGAAVSVVGLQATAVSDDRGSFVFVSVPAGTYTVAAEADGYKCGVGRGRRRGRRDRPSDRRARGRPSAH